MNQTDHLCALSDAYFNSHMRSAPSAAAREEMMASTASRCSTRWITVIVSSVHLRTTGPGVCAAHGGVRSVSTFGAEILWRGGKSACGGAGKALTLRGLSGKWCTGPG